MLRWLTLVTVLSISLPASAAEARGSWQGQRQFRPSGKSQRRYQPKRRKGPRHPSRNLAGKRSKWHLGVGGGLFSSYPPQATVEVHAGKRGFEFGLEAGYLAVPLSEFDATSTYMGLLSRYYFTDYLFLGLAAGRRNMTIRTLSDFTVDGITHDVAWKRQVSQDLLAPTIGVRASGYGNSSLIMAIGGLFGQKERFKITSDPEAIEGLPDAEFAAEREKKANDVKRVVLKNRFHLEMKYVLSF